MRAGLAVLIVMATAACDAPLPRVITQIVERKPEPVRPRVVSTRYDCGGRVLLLATFADHAVLVDPDGELILQPHPSANGTLWANGDITFWTKGTEGVFDRDGEAAQCRELPDPLKLATQSGIDLRAVGQEPGWFVEIDEDRFIHLVYDYAERELTTRAPSKTLEPPDRIVYSGAAGARTVRVIVDRKPCADVMSGEPYPLTVAVTIDDRELEGCGRPVSQTTAR